MEIDLAEVCSGKFEKEAKNMQGKKKGRCFKQEKLGDLEIWD